LTRIAIIDREYCKPSKCNLECIRFCPINRRGVKKAVELSPDGKVAVIYEDICIGCGICIKKCPFKAISIVNIPEEFEKNVVHRYGENMFKLYNLPILKKGRILGIIGRNGSGKTTSIKILSGLLRPNLGRYSEPPEWDEIIRRFRGTELQNYLKSLAGGKLRAVVKIQYVELAKRALKGTVKDLLKRADERGIYRDVIDYMGLKEVMHRNIKHLSGGELQKFLISAVLVKDADAYFFDEPCSYLDVRERMRIAKAIHEFINVSDRYIAVIEHDLTILDYISDNVVVIYGEPGVYGIVSKPYGVRAGINHYLQGYLPAENMRIRKEAIRFRILVSERISPTTDYPIVQWSSMIKSYGNGFKLLVEAGEAYPGEIIGILGPNGIGKTTFIKLLGGELEPDDGEVLIGVEKISYKPQEISPKIFDGDTVAANLRLADLNSLNPASWIYAELIRKLGLHRMLDRYVEDLSGGELQKLAIAVSLSRKAQLYLLDEPSAYLDVEERLSIARVIRRIIEEKRVTAFIVEHDLMLQNFAADKIMVFTGEPGITGKALKPVDLKTGFNMLLKELDITFRRDPVTGRPRVNKPGSYLDRYQKSRGEYYMLEETCERRGET